MKPDWKWLIIGVVGGYVLASYGPKWLPRKG